MKALAVLNGSTLHKFHRGMPEAIDRALHEQHPKSEVAISRSLEHMLQLIGRGVERGFELILVGGGDGTLYHTVNLPGIERVVVAPLPLGTVNAFLRAARVSVDDPMEALRQLLAGDVAECSPAKVNDRRIACFASIGYDARVVHRNSPKLKRMIGGASYGLTGLGELAISPLAARSGRIRFDTDRRVFRAASVVISKIPVYAGSRCFATTAVDPYLQAVWTRHDNPASLLAMAGSLALKLPEKDHVLPGVGRIGAFSRARWRSEKPAWVQLDGEAITLDDSRVIDIRIDPVKQRFLMPKRS
ncbi:hypothetical protein KQI84_01685 [bacterium]|nr:hypothetical protein [bacterium]